MPETLFDRDAMASWYVQRHFNTDPGVRRIYYLKANTPEREIRLLEVNDLIVEREADPSEPFDFGVDVGSDSAHKLLVVDVTPAQFERIEKKEIDLPKDWSLDGALTFER